jgi:hypothetical protein
VNGFMGRLTEFGAEVGEVAARFGAFIVGLATRVGEFLGPLGEHAAALFASVGESAGALLESLPDGPWLTIALAAALLARAAAVLALGRGGAALRGLLGFVAGGVLVAQLALSGPRVSLLPLHAMAALAVLLLPFERPHPEPEPLRIGRNRHRRARRPALRALLALLAVAGATAWALLGG